MTAPDRLPDAGFTLIEALVAMVILGLGAVSLMTAAEGHTGRISDVTDRIAARWVAENALVMARLNIADDGQPVAMYGQDFTVTRDTGQTDDPDLASITLHVTQTASDRQLFVLNGYISTQAQP